MLSTAPINYNFRAEKIIAAIDFKCLSHKFFSLPVQSNMVGCYFLSRSSHE
jgi:hypothetical protein